MTILSRLQRLADEGVIDRFAWQFAEFLASKDPSAAPELISRGAELAQALARQNTCVDLSEDPASPFPKFDGDDLEPGDSALLGDGSTSTLLTREGPLLYLSRYHRYERAVALDLLRRIQQPVEVDETKLAGALRRLFDGTQSPDWQRVAAVVAATQSLAIITGGPGTGKTTTVQKLLAAIKHSAPQPRAVALAAPTGKAAARLTASMQIASMQTASMQIADGASSHPEGDVHDALSALPTEATTLHRLLGARPFESGYRYDRNNPLPIDILVIDEVSMVDLALFAHTLDALPAHAQLILLGDPNQLPSVDAGNVLRDVVTLGDESASTHFSVEAAARIKRISGDGVATAASANLLQDALVRLTHNYRFEPADTVGAAARAALAGDASGVADALAMSPTGSALKTLDAAGTPILAEHYAAYTRALTERADAAALLSRFEAARVLGARRDGPYGIVALNERIEGALAAAGAIFPGPAHYHGRPILITRNDYNLRLYNGDVGLCYVEDGQHLAVFRQADGTLLRYLASRLPPHETCFAMTVHKSQGSEFDEVALVLPTTGDANAQELETRELVYTAITRARERFVLYAADGATDAALQSRTTRRSGLPGRIARLTPEPPGPRRPR